MEITFALIGILGVLVGYKISLVIQKFEEKALYKEIIFKEKINMYREIFEELIYFIGINVKNYDSVEEELNKLANTIFIYSSVIPSGVSLISSNSFKKILKLYQTSNAEEISEELSKEITKN